MVQKITENLLNFKVIFAPVPEYPFHEKQKEDFEDS